MAGRQDGWMVEGLSRRWELVQYASVNVFAPGMPNNTCERTPFVMGNTIAHRRFGRRKPEKEIYREQQHARLFVFLIKEGEPHSLWRHL